MKFYNLGHKTFETDFNYITLGEGFLMEYKKVLQIVNSLNYSLFSNSLDRKISFTRKGQPPHQICVMETRVIVLSK